MHSSPTPNDDLQPPVYLWHGLRWGVVILCLVLAGLVAAISLGVADPRPAGSFRWEERWEGESSGWQPFGDGVAIGDGQLEIDVDRDQIGGAVTRAEGKAYTFEAAGGQLRGEVGAAYGIVFGYEAPASFVAVLINGNGYAEVASADGRVWMAWQQWPNILLGYEANRVRVDVEQGEGLIRVNDEILMKVPVGEGGVGLIARGSADGQRVRFGWAKFWSK